MTSVADKYAKSVSSSHLECTEFTGDIDALIAAGLIRDGLATLLWRARAEYDAAHKPGAGNCSATDRLLALSSMPSLSGAVDALGRHVAKMARCNGKPADVPRLIASKAMNHYLDPNCSTCRGVKFESVPGTGRLSAYSCKACGGSGKDQIKGKTQEETDMIRDVLDDINRKTQAVSRAMRKWLRESA